MAYQSEIEKLEARFREKPEQWFAALADQYRKAGDADMALELLKAWIDKRPNYTSGYIVLGRCLLDKQRFDDAADAFESVLRLDMENVIALQSLSEIAERRGDLDGARAWLERLLDADPMNDEAREALVHLGTQPAAVAEAAETPEATELQVNEPMLVPEDEDTEAASAGEAQVDTPTAEELDTPLEIERASDAFEPLVGDSEGPRVSLPDQPVAAIWQPWDQVAPEEPGGGEPGESVKSVVEQENVRDTGNPEESAEDQEQATTFPSAPQESDAEGVGGEPLEGLESAEFVVPEATGEAVVEGLEPAEAAEPVGETPAVEGLESGEFEAPAAVPERVEGYEPSPVEAAMEESRSDVVLAGESTDGGDGVEPEVGETQPPTSLEGEGQEPYVQGEPQETATEPAEPTMQPVYDGPPAAEDAPAAPGTAQPEGEVEGVAEGIDTAPESEAIPVGDAATDDDHRELPIILPEEVSAELEEPGIREPEPVVTETMAELYVAQGLYAEARDIYGKLLDQNPGNERIRNRLAEVVEHAAGAKLESAPARRDRYVAVGKGSLSVGELMRRLAGHGSSDSSQPAVPSPDSVTNKPPAFSFDEYFGPAGDEPGESDSQTEPASEPPVAETEGDGTQDEDFRDWLRGLKT